MDRRALDSYVARARGILSRSPPTSPAATWRWLVSPLLSTLGWDVDSSRCQRRPTVQGVELAAVLSVDLDAETPALFVAVEGAETSVRADGEQRLRRAMAVTGVDRGIYTDGRRYVLRSGPRGSNRLAIDLDSIPERERVLAEYSPDVLERRLADRDGSLAGRRLAVARDDLAVEIADALRAAAGESNREELLASTTQFLDELIDWFGDRRFDHPDESGAADEGPFAGNRNSSREERAAEGASSPGTDPIATETASRAEPTADEPVSPRANASTGRESTVEAPTSGRTDRTAAAGNPPQSAEPTGSADGEYVVRFFNERGSIGGVGHSNPAMATVAAAEFCFERGLSGVRLPWRLDDDGVTVLHEEPVLADGSPMPAHRQLSNGLYLNTAGELAELAERVAGLAARCNLRAMIRGDWSLEE